MNKVVFFEERPKREFIDCRITSMRDYFNYKGILLDSYDLFIIGEAIDFIMDAFKVKKESPIVISLAGCTNLEYEEQLFRNLGIPYEVKRFEEDVRKTIQGYIDQGEPVIAYFDLRYAKGYVAPNNGVDIHCVSTTLVCGYDFEQKILLIDLKDKNATGLYSITLEDFEKSIDSKCFPLHVDRRYIVPSIDKEVVQVINEDYKSIIYKALQHTADRMLEGSSSVLDNIEHNSIEVKRGLQGVKSLIEWNSQYIKQLEQITDTTVANKLFSMIYRAMREEMTPGSNYCYRKEFGESLVHIADKLANKELRKIGKQALEAANLWRKFVRYLSHYDRPFTNKKVFIEGIIDRLEVIYKFETTMFLELKKQTTP